MILQSLALGVGGLLWFGLLTINVLKLGDVEYGSDER